MEALGSGDPSILTEAKTLVAPGSVADLYLQHQLDQAQASTDAGESPEPDKLTVKGDGEFESCDGDECVIWGSIEAEGEKISSLTVNGKQLKDRLLAGNGRKVKLGRLGDAELLSAYESAGGSLIVCLRIKNTSANSIAIESRTSYRSAEGRQSAVGGQTGPVALQPDSLAYFALAFAGAKLGGDLHLEMFSENGGGPSGSARIPLR